MEITKSAIESFNEKRLNKHSQKFDYTKKMLSDEGVDVAKVIDRLSAFKVATPSWALGTGGTRFGRFPFGGEPGSLEQKIEDVGVLKQLSYQTDSVSLHIPWDYPSDFEAIRQKTSQLGLKFDAINSNTFQDQPNFKSLGKKSYKFGSLCSTDAEVRKQAIDHNVECISIGNELGSKALTVWLADGTCYPGQANFRGQFERTLSCLQEIYKSLPADWEMFVEHKPFEPNFYSSVNQDWGSSLLLATKTGPKCKCLVDLGHHLPNANIEQIVSRVLMENRLGGFHFNDSKYSDDDLTVGSLKPYQLFLIFNELVSVLESPEGKDLNPAWMIDASHNYKDPLEDILQSLEAIAVAYAQALLIDQKKLASLQNNNDVAGCQELLQNAYRTDVRPLIAEMRLRNGSALSAIDAYRHFEVRKGLINERGVETRSTGL